LGGHGTHVSRHRFQAAVTAALAAVLALSVAACGGESSSDANETAGTYEVEVTDAAFATKQKVGHSYRMVLGVRNSGRKTIPALIFNVSIKGKEGQASTLPFGIHDPQPELAQPDRPVWVLSEHFPKLFNYTTPGGAETSNPKTFDFGPIKAGKQIKVFWLLNAVRPGKYTLLYTIDAGLSGSAKAKTSTGTVPGGSFAVTISQAPYKTVVSPRGEVIEVE
jgi:hypothetical protein